MKVKYVFLISFLIMILTGCTTSELNMNINSNGDVSLVHTILVNDSDFDYISNIIKEDREKFDYNEYNVEKVSQNGMTGYKINRVIGNIKNLSNNDNNSVELNKYASDDFNTRILFTDVKNIFTNKYVAKYTVDLTSVDKAVMYLPIFNGSVYTTSGENNDDIEKLNSDVTTTFVLDSEVSIGENNATKHENGEYIWELKYGKINEIYFEVNKINNSALITGCVFILIVGTYYFITNSRKRKINAYNSVTLKESLDLEYKSEKKNQIRDIRLKRKYSKDNEINDDEAYSINERIRDTATSLGAYSNQETIEKLNNRIIGNSVKKEVIPINEQKDPDFKSVNSQVMETIEKVKDDNNKFLDKKDEKN